MSEIGMTNFTDTNCGVRIEDSEHLEALNMPNLKNFYISHPRSTLPNITIRLVSQSFCVTVQEMSNFMSSDYYETGNNFGTNFRPISDNLYLENQKVCEIRNFSISNFDECCERIIGNVVIKNGDEQYVHKLKNVSWVYGSIYITYTNLEVIDFLDNLEYVVRSTDIVDIIVEHNKKLVNAKFPNLKKAGEIYFFDNENLVIDPNLCFGVMNGLNVTEVRGIRFEDDNCEFLHFPSAIHIAKYYDWIGITKFCATAQEMSNFMSSDYYEMGKFYDFQFLFSFR
ncbi:hypothetical protein B9Z55_018364 [Caenorhabditis nigoni]|uniref:Receptor L-domain domain-containing protein n=2 Tax=Caenorhabditis nigoni TaxID=1611254 RepID=A0A2G5TDJ1_9PELO|nr:hypothetical protein B9Z55_018364 [Caenorhabditis nigoni]